MQVSKKNSEKEFINWMAESFQPSNNLARLSENNKNALVEMISYLTKIKNQELITQKQFSDLLALGCANYIENEVELRITKSLDQRFFSLLENLGR